MTRAQDEIDWAASSPLLFLGVPCESGWRRSARLRRGRELVEIEPPRHWAGYASFAGLVLPLAQASGPLASALNAAMSLLAVPAGANPRVGKGPPGLQAQLDELGIPLSLRGHEPDGSCAWGFAEDDLFQAMAGAFHYLELPRKETGSDPVPPNHRRFRWNSARAFIEWLHDPLTSAWLRPIVFLFPEGPPPARANSQPAWTGARLFSQGMALADWFTLRADLDLQPLQVLLELEPNGWAVLSFVVGTQRADIDLSEVYPPFNEMMEWINRLEAGETGLTLNIYDEADNIRLTAHDLGRPSAAFLTVHADMQDGMRFQAVVEIRHIVDGIRSAFLRSLEDPALEDSWRYFLLEENCDPELPDPRPAAIEAWRLRPR